MCKEVGCIELPMIYQPGGYVPVLILKTIGACVGWHIAPPDIFRINFFMMALGKHIYFLHARALKIELLDDNVLNEIQFGTPKEIMQKLSRSGLKVNDVLRNNYAETGDEKAFSIESKVEQKPFWGENCAICFEDFSKPKDEIDLRLALDSIVYCYGTCVCSTCVDPLNKNTHSFYVCE